ncbi:ASCH domain-containing protein [Furfurilactobacillus curtus]|uniref:ASCH domain-containing protein n=1 Tax=Furfurilactobacillus curtus TaxID=1746200 RepID=A0ABQ5JQL8_9LACO
MKALLSIKPEFVSRIKDGEKRFEFRKIQFKQPVQTIVVYATRPLGKVVGEFTVKNVLADKPEMIWDATKDGAGVSKTFFDEYYENHKVAVAIEIGDFFSYKKPMSLTDFDESLSVAPQSFCYLGS